MQHGQLSQEILQRVVWLRGQLLCWFEQHRRAFPWREPGRSAYGLAVAEILLQRTTAAGVARAFPGLIARYPTWEVMARTSLEELQALLHPLGLWRQKAQVLINLANVVEKRGGELPCSRHDLERLPGVGPYTASVVMVEVFGLQEPFVDVNMSRVLSRFFGTQTCATSSRSASLYTLAFHLVSSERCLSVNWAILDFAALVCRARSPLCQECLLWKECQFVKGGTASLDGG